MPSQEASFLELVIGTMRYLSCADGIPITEASNVIVTGLGPAGLLYVQYAKILGAKQIWVADRNPPRLEIASRFGATEVFGSIEELSNAVCSEGLGVDVICETTGCDISSQFAEAIKENCYIAGFGVGFDLSSLSGNINGKTIRVGGGGVEECNSMIPLLAEWLKHDKLNLAAMVSKTISLSEIPEELEGLQKRPKKAVKIVVLPQRTGA